MSNGKGVGMGTPSADPRPFTDEAGRRWSGFLMSGRHHEEQPEVVFVCEDVPSEPKRTARLDATGDVASQWRGLDQSRILELFRDSEPAS